MLDRALAGIESGAPGEVFLQLLDSDRAPREEESFAATLAAMYVSWGARRGMRVHELHTERSEHLFAISGLGCGEILRREAGLHVLEHVDDEHEGAKIVDRDRVRVLVAARPLDPDVDGDALARHAREAVDSVGAEAVVVRRYRPGRAPLVRDSARGYRTGRLDRVLAGDFDLY